MHCNFVRDGNRLIEGGRALGGFNGSHLMGIKRRMRDNDIGILAKNLLFTFCKSQKVLLCPKNFFAGKISIWVSKNA
jgi:hypothetical protein